MGARRRMGASMLAEAAAELEALVERMSARAKLVRQVLEDTKADLAKLDQMAAAAPDALRAGDARVDARSHA